MEWLEVSIYTTNAGIDPICGRLYNIGVTGVEIKDNTVSITAHVIVKYGYRIPELAWKIQEMVKTQVEDMTGLEVLKVNFSVDGIKFPEEEKAPEKMIYEIDISGI